MIDRLSEYIYAFKFGVKEANPDLRYRLSWPPNTVLNGKWVRLRMTSLVIKLKAFSIFS